MLQLKSPKWQKENFPWRLALALVQMLSRRVKYSVLFLSPSLNMPLQVVFAYSHVNFPPSLEKLKIKQ